jgi:hypothetical protein
LLGNDLLPSGSFTVVEDLAFEEQHEHPDLCRIEALVFGSLALRSLIAWAVRCAAGVPANAAAVTTTRGASLPQSGHGCGKLDSFIERIVSKTP